MRTARRRGIAPARSITVQGIGAVTYDVATTSAAVAAVTKQTAVGSNVLACVKLPVGITATSVTDTQGNTWALDLVDPNGAQAIAQIWRTTLAAGKALGTADSVTVNLPSPQGTATVILLEVAGLVAASPLDRTATHHLNGTPGAPNGVGPTGTTTQAVEVAVSAFGVGGGTGQGLTFTPPAGWTEVPSGTVNPVLDVAYLVLSSTQTVSATWTDSNTVQNTSAIIATYKGA